MRGPGRARYDERARSSLPNAYLTPEEYLELERRAEYKSEYYQGRMFAMSGASPAHGLIVGNLVGSLWQQLRQRPCRVYPNDLRLRVSETGLYTYPDVTVVCGEAKFAEDQKDTLLNPTVIIEVLSESTRAYDLGDKLHHYRTLPSLTDYLTVEQDKPRIYHWIRQPVGQGFSAEYSDLAQSIQLPSIGCVLALANVYENIEWPDA